ncbi:type IV pilus biogenesis/stability protein PilW [Vibrio paucivorans]|uniref:Type IV pilus biogenesis/stability protein PilW n=1 Tax=Vibrio paucivorans TaxID=2829489 RepID=A0A9X3CBC0_9VIBR|nr:type IV pilus biogenesis/stability protein PilW [Vibrio paucivorans]MCW8332542.1 type IV pilus biogenesis/stability protein PilW [Vibrio paucivorans]
MKRAAVLFLLANLFGCVTVTQDGKPEVKSDPIDMAESRITLGLGYLEQGNMLKARENLEIALKHAPSYYRAQLSIAHYYEQVGELDSARNTYRKALRQHPKNGNILNNYGTFLCKQGEYQQADKYFNKAIDQPYYYLVSASYENAAFCALKAGQTDQAKYYFARTIDHDPNRVRSILQLAKLEIEAGEYTEARIKLMQIHQRYGLQKPSLQLLIQLEKAAGNKSLQIKYQNQLDQMMEVS